VEFVYDLSEDLTILTEERSARGRRTGSESYADVKAKIDAKEAAKMAAISLLMLTGMLFSMRMFSMLGVNETIVETFMVKRSLSIFVGIS
jgi:hypothetical protein